MYSLTVHQIMKVPGKRNPFSLDVMLDQHPLRTLFLWSHVPIEPMIVKLQDFLKDI